MDFIDLTADEAKLIVDSVAANPWHRVQNLMPKLITQFNEQMAPAPAQSPPPAPAS